MLLLAAAKTVESINYSNMLITMSEMFLMTLLIFFVTIVIALPLGLPIAFGRMSRFSLIRTPVKFFLTVIRGTPLMLQLIFFCYGPFFLFGIPSIRLLATFLAFGINYACYFAEIYRGGIEAIPIGQHEAAEALGFTKRQTFFKIILPQVIKNILPAMGNEFMTLVKDTSLARVIAVVELLSISEKLMNGYASMIPLIVAGAFYLITNSIVSRAFGAAEKKLSYYR